MNIFQTFTADTDAPARAAAKEHALAVNASAARQGLAVRFHATKVAPRTFTVRESARSPFTVVSSEGVECHAPSGYAIDDYSGSNGSRERMERTILAFWSARGMAREIDGIWHVRDNAQGAAEWLPLATTGESGRADRADRSHVIAADNGGAACGCGLVGESSAVNNARGGRDMTMEELAPAWRDTLAAWPVWWRENVARKASLARL